MESKAQRPDGGRQAAGLEAGIVPSTLPFKQIPGSYGPPILGPIMDRLDFYYNQGQDKYFSSRADKYNSTVVRLNVPPGPYMASNAGVIALLDAKSFPVLFDVSKVEKKDVFTGTYVPSTSLTGGYRVCAYLDPSEPTHAVVKQLLLSLLASRKDVFIPTFRTHFSALFSSVESQIALKGKSDFNTLNDVTSLDFLGDAYFGATPSNSALGSTGPTKTAKWLFFQLCPLLTLGLPRALEELLLHSFPLPPIFVQSDYNKMYAYFSSAAGATLDAAEKLGLSRDEACHNLLFATLFNSYGGLKLLFPIILVRLAAAGSKLHAKLAQEVRAAVAAAGGKVTLAAVEGMELVRSAVYEALRLDPPVKFQYGKAKTDLVVENHEAAFRVSKGEMLFGYQPLATRDAKVFGSDAEEYVADRFVGEEGRKLLQYVVWSNGPETESPSVGNKQCPGKDLVVLVGRLFLVEIFLRYDTFEATVSNGVLGTTVTFTSVTKASSAV